MIQPYKITEHYIIMQIYLFKGVYGVYVVNVNISQLCIHDLRIDWLLGVSNLNFKFLTNSGYFFKKYELWEWSFTSAFYKKLF